MITTTDNSYEARAMAANDVRALAEQLNDAIKRAVDQELRVELSSSTPYSFLTGVSSYPSVRVQILMKVE